MQLQLHLIHRLTEIKCNGLEKRNIGWMDTRNDFVVRNFIWTKTDVLLMFHWTGEAQALKFEFEDLEDGSGKQYSDGE